MFMFYPKLTLEQLEHPIIKKINCQKNEKHFSKRKEMLNEDDIGEAAWFCFHYVWGKSG